MNHGTYHEAIQAGFTTEQAGFITLLFWRGAFCRRATIFCYAFGGQKIWMI
jgi:hypothetical protein